MNNISAVITTLNAEDKLAACLSSVKWVDELIVIDDGSTDETVNIAKKFTKKIFHHQSKGYVEPARNFSINKATKEWILVLDSDEEVSQALGKKLLSIVEEDDQTINAVAIPRKNIIFEKWIEHSTGW